MRNKFEALIYEIKEMIEESSNENSEKRGLLNKEQSETLTGKLKEAEINFQKAFDICIKSLSNDSSFLPIFLRTLNCFANLQSKNNLLDDAEKKFQEALDICNELAIDNRSLFFNALAGLYNNLGILLIKKNGSPKLKKKFLVKIIIFFQNYS